jgi:PqqD family protein of HPr-rel-A system
MTPAPTTMPDRWRLDALADATWRHWDGETVVHHRLSNDTHRLAEPAGWILERLAAGECLTIDALAAKGAYAREALAAAVHALASLDLVRQC